MKLIKDISIEQYDDSEFCLNYLNTHKIIGDEDVSYDGIFHIHWRSTLNEKIIFQIKSILATQYVTKIYLWIENQMVTMLSPTYILLMQFNKFLEIKVFNKTIFNQIKGDFKNKERIWQYYTGIQNDHRYRTDILRHVILSIYGGMYTDCDTFLLRDVRDIHLKNWSATWGLVNVSNCAEFCILKEEKDSDIYEQMFLTQPTNTYCFAIGNDFKHSAFNIKHEKINLTVLPDTFFDPVWINHDKNLPFLTVNNFDKFFEKTIKEITMDNFFKGCFAYHWHNRWSAPELKDSYAGRLNQDLDRIIEEKYNIKPYKIFNN